MNLMHGKEVYVFNELLLAHDYFLQLLKPRIFFCQFVGNIVPKSANLYYLVQP